MMDTISRRSFLRFTGVTALAVMGTSALSGCSSAAIPSIVELEVTVVDKTGVLQELPGTGFESGQKIYSARFLDVRIPKEISVEDVRKLLEHLNAIPELPGEYTLVITGENGADHVTFTQDAATGVYNAVIELDVRKTESES